VGINLYFSFFFPVIRRRGINKVFKMTGKIIEGLLSVVILNLVIKVE